MSKRFGREEDLVAALGELPRSVRPDRDLWPGIARRLRDRRSHSGARGAPWHRRALVASLVLAFVVGILVGRQMAPGEPAAEDRKTAQGAWARNPAVMAAIRASEREYQASFKSFAPLAPAPSVLGAGAVKDIEAGWAELKEAETALLTALDEYPDNPFLGAKLVDLRVQQLEFIRHLHMVDRMSRRQT